MANFEEILRVALNWAKENDYIIDRRFVYDKYCDAIRALILHNKQEVITNNSQKTMEAAKEILKVTTEWVRAFAYGFGGNMPRLLGGSGPWSGPALEQPAEAFELGQKLG